MVTRSRRDAILPSSRSIQKYSLRRDDPDNRRDYRKSKTSQNSRSDWRKQIY